MAKKKSQNGWVKTLCIGLVCLAVGGLLTFGIVKAVDYFKTVKTDKEQTEQQPEKKDDQATATEMKIATANVEKYLK